MGDFLKTATLSLAFCCFILAFLFQIQGRKEKTFLRGVAHGWRDRPLALVSHLSNQEEAVALSVMNSVHHMMKNREDVVRSASLGNPSSFFRWISEDLNDPGGQCGGYSNVLGRLLMELGYDVRKIGLEKGKVLSYHQVIEVKLNDRWVVLDPWFNLVFRKPDGSFAGASDLSHNWKYYGQQTPDQYPPDYDYQAYHYTNWKRLGVVGKILRRIIDSEEPGHEFSAFRYLARKDQYAPWIFAGTGLFVLVIHLIIYLVMRRSRHISLTNSRIPKKPS